MAIARPAASKNVAISLEEYVRIDRFKLIENYFFDDSKRLPDSMEIFFKNREIKVYGICREEAINDLKKVLSSVAEPVVLRKRFTNILYGVVAQEVGQEKADTQEKIDTLGNFFQEDYIPINLLKPRVGERLYYKIRDHLPILWFISSEKVSNFNARLNLWGKEFSLPPLEEKDTYLETDEITPYLPALSYQPPFLRLEEVKKAIKSYLEAENQPLDSLEQDLLCPIEELLEKREEPMPELLVQAALQSLEATCSSLSLRVEFIAHGRWICAGAVRNPRLKTFSKDEFVLI